MSAGVNAPYWARLCAFMMAVTRIQSDRRLTLTIRSVYITVTCSVHVSVSGRYVDLTGGR